MATFNLRYGWQWTDVERHERQDAIRKARRLMDNIREQARRFATHLPQFKDRAEQALRQLTTGLGTVPGMNITNRGPKYQPISPEEADRLLGALPQAMKLWEEFVTAPDVAEASCQKSREIRASNARARERDKAVDALYAATWDQFAEVLRTVDKGDFIGALDKASDMGIL